VSAVHEVKYKKKLLFFFKSIFHVCWPVRALMLEHKSFSLFSAVYRRCYHPNAIAEGELHCD